MTPFPSVDDLPVLDIARPDPQHATSVERARRRAHQDGHAAGYQEGYQHGLTMAQADVARDAAVALGALRAGVEALAARDAAGLHELTTTAIDLALAVAEAVLQREVALSPTAGRDALVRAIALAPDRGTIDAHLHPNDLAAIGATDGLAPGSDLRLVADSSVERGGCVLHVGATRVDAQIGTALERVRQELWGDDAGQVAG